MNRKKKTSTNPTLIVWKLNVLEKTSRRKYLTMTRHGGSSLTPTLKD